MIKKTVVFCLFLAVIWMKNVHAFNEEIPEENTLTIADLVDKAVSHYHAEEWNEAANFFEKALVSYRMLHHVSITCEDRCKNANISKELQIDFKEHHDLQYMGNILAKSNCIKLCREEHPFASTVQYIPPQLQEDLDSKKAYDFLQFAYYNLNAYKKASQAAFTFYQANSENEQAYENVKRYQEMEGMNEKYFKDLEAPKFYDNFVKGVTAYEDQNYGLAVISLEKSLMEYYISHEECLALCYKPSFPTYFYRFYKAMTEHYVRSLECELECNEKLDPVVAGNHVENFAAECYSYLQFSYYQLQNYEMAVASVMSALLLNPEQENGEQNVKYYRSTAEEHNLSEDKHFHPRKDAVKLNSYLNEVKEMVEIGKEVLYKDDEGEVYAGDPTEMSSLIANLADSIAVKLDEKLQNI